jgi:hypothetical protein
LALWEESVTQSGGVVTLVGGETTPGREKGGDDTSWVDTNFFNKKMKKIHMVYSVVINGR